MNASGGGKPDLLVRSRSALLDALVALEQQRDAVIVIGAQAIYLRTGGAQVALAESTKDCDLAFDPRQLEDDPLVESSMAAARFYREPGSQPGAWHNPTGIPVDLMVPEALAGGGRKGARGGRIPPHAQHATRRARGLEAVVVDNSILKVTALDPADHRSFDVRVAGAAGLLVAKLHKIGERVADPGRLLDKDAHDIYRILRGTPTAELATKTDALLADSLSEEPTREAIVYLTDLFAADPRALGAHMAGRAEEGIGEPDTVSLSVSFLAADLIAALGAS